MRYILAFILTTIFLHASNLLTYNIYERTDRVDIMLSFDAPFEGKIYQKQEKDFTSLVLDGLEYSKTAQESINSDILQDLIIEPINDATKVTLKSKHHIGLFASKTIDGFGLRIRAKLVAPAIKDLSKQENKPLPSSSKLVDDRYFIVIGIMFVLLIFLYFLKRKLILNGGKNGIKLPFALNNNGLNILAQKPIDAQNKISLVEHNGNKYLLLTGTSNVLLDKYDANGITIETKGDFELLFEENQKKLNAYLNTQTSGQLNSYKQKLSQDFNSED